MSVYILIISDEMIGVNMIGFYRSKKTRAVRKAVDPGTNARKGGFTRPKGRIQLKKARRSVLFSVEDL